MDIMNPRVVSPSFSSRIFTDSPLEDVNAALQTIPAVTITETNKLIYATTTVILEVLGYKLNMSKGQYPWRRQLEAKSKATWIEVSQLSKLERARQPKY